VTSEYHTLRAFNFYTRVFPEGTRFAAVAAASERFRVKSHNRKSVVFRFLSSNQDEEPEDEVYAALPTSPDVASPASPDLAAMQLARTSSVSTAQFTVRDGSKVAMSLRDMFRLASIGDEPMEELPRGEPLELLFQLFKPKELKGHGLYNGDCQTGPVNFDNEPPEMLLRRYLDKYQSEFDMISSCAS